WLDHWLEDLLMGKPRLSKGSHILDHNRVKEVQPILNRSSISHLESTNVTSMAFVKAVAPWIEPEPGSNLRHDSSSHFAT
ncbi:unnamed protein product, partial [Sphenostylis stenocarpa]